MKPNISYPLIEVLIIFLISFTIVSAQIIPHPSVEKDNPSEWIDAIILIWIGFGIFIIGVFIALRNYLKNKSLERELYGKYPIIK